MPSVRLGIVVIGRNEGDRLIACLLSFSEANADIVYVDSGSTDGSIAAAVRLGARIVRLDMTTSFTAARARNAGFAELKAINPALDLVQFVDGDCAISPDWLIKASAFLAARPDVAVVCGRRRERHPERSIYNALCDLEWDTPVGEADACGGDALMRAEALEAVGGYRPRLIAGEEPELCLRLRERGWKIWRLDEEMTSHDAAITKFSQWWKRAVRCGHAYAEIAWMHRNSEFGIWRANAVRTVVWGGLLPLGFLLASAFDWRFLLLFLIYPAQIARIALKHGILARFSWIYATLITVSKFAEFVGVLRFSISGVLKINSIIIEYK